MKKRNTNKLLLVFALVAFCLSNATMGELLLHGHEIHFVQNTVHVHHIAGDHSSGESDHKDAKDFLSFDYLPLNTSNATKTICIIKPFLFSRFSPQQDKQFIRIASKNLYSLSTHRFYSSGNIYQLNSAYLI